jgi:Flp pilus assembly CpaE family ATPase
VEALLHRSSRGQPAEKASEPNTIGFLGCKGGTGLTTLVVNAAISLATGQVTPAQAHEPNRDGRIVVAELRTGMATAALQLGLPQHDGLGAVLDRPIGQIDAEFIEAQLDEHQSGLLLLGSRPEPIKSVKRNTAEHAEAIVRHLGTRARYLFLDLGVGLDEVNKRALGRCRHTVVAVEPSSIALSLAEKLLEEMNQELKIPRHRISIILIKRSRSAASYTKEDIEEELGHNLIGMIPPAPELAFESSKQRTPMVLVHLDSLVVRQFRNFAKDLTGKL